jgi:hypothetical protein
LIFEPIHRVLFNVDIHNMMNCLKNYFLQNSINYQEGHDIVVFDQYGELGLSLSNTNNRLPVDILQTFLDEYLTQHPKTTIDYVHGDEALESLGKQAHNCGIRLGAINKNSLFPAIKAGGVLPRKTFSMGEAHEKRYYIECRQIMK